MKGRPSFLLVSEIHNFERQGVLYLDVALIRILHAMKSNVGGRRVDEGEDERTV